MIGLARRIIVAIGLFVVTGAVVLLVVPPSPAGVGGAVVPCGTPPAIKAAKALIYPDSGYCAAASRQRVVAAACLMAASGWWTWAALRLVRADL